METSLVYILKTSGVLFVFFALYQIALRKVTFFNWNRHFLLAGLVSSFLFPFVYITKYSAVAAIASTSLSTITNMNISATVQESPFNWLQFLFIIYSIGAFVLTIKFLVQLLSLRKIIVENESKKVGNYIYVETSRKITPFSFFKYIVYNPALYSDSELKAIIQHEKVHSSQWHSIDILIAHLTTIVLWINPVAWFYKKSMQQNIEFLADDCATQNMPSIKSYQYALVKNSGNQFCTAITNNFYNSLIKKRIVMLQKSKSSKNNLWKYSLVVPLLIAFVFLFNTKVVALDANTKNITLKKTELIITKNTTNAELETMKKELGKDDIDFSYTVVHNDNKEIINISIHINAGKHNGSFSTESDTPIKAIHISIDKNQNIAIGNVDVDHDVHVSIHKDHDIHIDHDGDKNVTVLIKEDVNGKKVVIVDGKEMTMDEFNKMDKNHAKIIESIHGGDHNIIIRKSDNNKPVDPLGHEGNKLIIHTGDGKGDPLFIVDGKEVKSNKVEKLNPDGIESIDVLKGESAEKKYGKKGKNGVIEITTKKKQ
ncbi:MAG: hypothetical protein COA50_02845 [Flavobacteriaceae bacterium]|nr:MAG: hypothetical protein COA50_02845 [Flavobacteriaceae bacterium]